MPKDSYDLDPYVVGLDPTCVIDAEMAALSAAVLRRTLPEPVMPRLPSVPLVALAPSVSPPPPATITIDSVSNPFRAPERPWVFSNVDYTTLETRILQRFEGDLGAAASALREAVRNHVGQPPPPIPPPPTIPNDVVWNCINMMSPSLSGLIIAEVQRVAKDYNDALPTVWQRVMEDDDAL